MLAKGKALKVFRGRVRKDLGSKRGSESRCTSPFQHRYRDSLHNRDRPAKLG
jgi:hypothetical protein